MQKNDGIVVCGLQKKAYLCKINGLFILRMALRGVIKSLQMRLYLFMQPLVGVLWTVLKVTNVLCALCVVGVVVYGLGFRQEALFAELITPFRWIYFLSLTEFLVLVVGDVFSLQPSRVWYLKLLAALLLLFVGISWLLPPSVAEQFVMFEWMSNPYLLFALVSAQAVINLSVFVTRSLHSRLNPTWIFVGSFVLLILVGTGLLMLPRSTTHTIRFIGGQCGVCYRFIDGGCVVNVYDYGPECHCHSDSVGWHRYHDVYEFFRAVFCRSSFGAEQDADKRFGRSGERYRSDIQDIVVDNLGYVRVGRRGRVSYFCEHWRAVVARCGFCRFSCHIGVLQCRIFDCARWFDE